LATRQSKFDLMQPESTSESLNAALEAIQETLRHPAATIFRKPVDHVALKLADYLTVIPNPVDLGTIGKQLEAGRKSNWRRSSYNSAEEVLSDGLRVFNNCEVYNRNDAATRQVAEDARQVFLSAWQAAGLDGPKPKKLEAKQASASKQDAPPSTKKQKQGGSSRGSGAAAEPPAKPDAAAEPAQPTIDPASCKSEAEVPARFSIQPGVWETTMPPGLWITYMCRCTTSQCYVSA
jgi:Bromodomain